MERSRSHKGLWQRLLLARLGKPVETLAQASWLQGPSFFVDLRQPPAIDGLIKARCLAKLQPHEARILAGQQGFAGHLLLSDDIAEWKRLLDFQAPTPLPDRGRLIREGDLLIEHGLDGDYVEYWQLQRQPADAPCAAARFLSESDGREVFLVQCGRHFAYARDRAAELESGSDLAVLLRNADAEEARALVDCEISFGMVTPQGWRIERSTLPWRVGARLLGSGARLDARLEIDDVNALGRPIGRCLKLLDLHGRFVFAPEQATAPKPAARPRRTTPFTEIPIVDISALGENGSPAETEVVTRLCAAASEVGFFHVTGHGIAPELAQRLLAAAKRFFHLPLEQKMASYIALSSNHRGYVPQGEENFLQGKDRKEAFDLALDLPADRVPPGHPMLGPNNWPELPGFREDVMAYYAAAFAVGRRLLRGFAMALGQPPDALDNLAIAPPSQLRLLHYPYQPEAQDIPGFGAHTDYECFTLLLATAPGLEAMNQAGEWIPVDPVPGALVVNIGDMLEFWSNGAFVATSHRVRKVARERYSFPLFFALDYDVELRPIGQKSGPAIRTGEHIFAQTVQSFRYLTQRAKRGEIVVPLDVPSSRFGREGQYRAAKPT